MFNIVLLVPDNLPENISKQSGSLQEMRAIFADWDPALNRFLDYVKTADKWKLMHRSEMSSWVNDAGNLVFIGDACHPMLPYVAQGAAQAIEDAGVLTCALSLTDSVPTALTVYESVRKERAERIQKSAAVTRKALHLPDGEEQRKRAANYKERNTKCCRRRTSVRPYSFSKSQPCL